MVAANFCERSVVKISLKTQHKIALYFWNLSCRNINTQKMLNYTLSCEIPKVQAIL